MKVLIVESSYPDDFYHRELDGNSVSSLLNTIRVVNELRYVLDLEHLKKAIVESAEGLYSVFHLSCHGGQTGIALADNDQPSWEEFAGAFQQQAHIPPVLVMSACCGASSGLGKAFASQKHRPKIIFGSTEALNFSEYAAAWSILYHRFKTDGFNRTVAQVALQHITAVVHPSFVYRRWDENLQNYRVYPSPGKSYEVVEVVHNE